jgi:glyoxalase-like protein
VLEGLENQGSGLAEHTSSEIDRQLPRADEIFLDHLAHFVPDAEAASRALARAGFAPMPISVQVNPDLDGAPRPTGTGNVTAMFARGYIEVLFKTSETPLTREFEAGLARHPGVHLAAFAVADAAAARRRLAETGFRVRPLVEMQRPVDADGRPATAAFTIARVEPGEMPEGRIQILTHRTEPVVWQPRWLSHPNGARALMRVLVAVSDIAEAAPRFGCFTGRAPAPTPFGQTIKLDRGRVDLLSADKFAHLLPEVPIPSLPFIGAYEIRVKSLTVASGLLMRAGLTVRQHNGELIAVFPPELGLGAWLFAE